MLMKTLLVFPVLGALKIETQSEFDHIYFTGTCDAPETICGKVKTGLRFAGNFIENAILLDSNVTVNVSYEKTINGKPWDSQAGMGLAKYVVVEDELGRVLYPQALARQKFKDELKGVDINLYLNANTEFYFPEDFLKPRPESSVYFMDTLVQQLLRGMGFGSALGRNVANSETSPVINYASSPPQFLVSVYDRHVITSDGSSILDKANQMNQHLPEQLNSQSPTLTLLSENQLKVTDQFNRLLTEKHSLKFLAADGEKFPIFTRRKRFLLGISGSRLDCSYRFTQDLLMTTKLQTGMAMIQYDLSTWLTSPIGPVTLNIMKTIGYRINPNPVFNFTLGEFKETTERHKFLVLRSQAGSSSTMTRSSTTTKVTTTHYRHVSSERTVSYQSSQSSQSAH